MLLLLCVAYSFYSIDRLSATERKPTAKSLCERFFFFHPIVSAEPQLAIVLRPVGGSGGARLRFLFLFLVCMACLKLSHPSIARFFRYNLLFLSMIEVSGIFGTRSMELMRLFASGSFSGKTRSK